MKSKYINLIKIIFTTLIVINICGCKKKHELLFGAVIIDGRITDMVSNQPIPNCTVKLLNVELGPSLIGTTPRTTTTAAEVITNADGKYSFNITANGQYEFEIFADPKSDKYVDSDLSNGQNKSIKTIGNFIRDLGCYRSGFAKIILKNIAPIDTPYFITFSARSEVLLNKFYRDTTFYIKVESRPTLKSNIHYNKNNEIINDYLLNIPAWDTVSINYQY